MIEQAWLPASTCSYNTNGSSLSIQIFAGLFICIGGALALSMLQLLLPHISKRFELDVSASGGSWSSRWVGLPAWE